MSGDVRFSRTCTRAERKGLEDGFLVGGEVGGWVRKPAVGEVGVWLGEVFGGAVGGILIYCYAGLMGD